VPLIADQRDGEDHRQERNANAELCIRSLGAGKQALDGSNGDEDCRDGDQDHLHQRGKRLCLSMAKAMIVIGRLRGDADAKQDDKTGNEIEAAVRERAKHRR
jgi:hypothetical protein